MTKMQTTEEFDLEFWNHAWDSEKEWRASLPRFTDKELLEIFSEVKQIIPEKIKEWERERVEFSDAIKKKLTLIKYKTTEEFSRWFWREWVKINEGEELFKIDSNISRLKRLLWTAKGRILKGQLSEKEIQRALNIPIENLINQPLRKSGRALVGLCPFHPEKHPSFFIYLETNTCWCYGCNQGGNTIKFIELLYGYSFKEAVRYLIGK